MRLNLDESEGFLDDVYDIMVVIYCCLYEKETEMSVKINAYNDNLRGRFEDEAKRIREVLGEEASIEHVGSS